MCNVEVLEILESLKETHTDDKLQTALDIAIKSIARHPMYIEPPKKDVLCSDLKKLSNQQVADKYFVSLQTLYNWKVDYGLIHVSFRDRVTDEQFKVIYESDMSVPKMAEKWKVSVHTVRQRAKDLTVKRPEKEPSKFSLISEEEFRLSYLNKNIDVRDLAIKWDTSASNIRRKASDLGISRRNYYGT